MFSTFFTLGVASFLLPFDKLDLDLDRDLELFRELSDRFLSLLLSRETDLESDLPLLDLDRLLESERDLERPLERSLDLDLEFLQSFSKWPLWWHLKHFWSSLKY